MGVMEYGMEVSEGMSVEEKVEGKMWMGLVWGCWYKGVGGWSM